MTKTHPLLRVRGAALRLGATLFALAACDGGGVTEPGPGPSPEPRITAVAVSPSGQPVQAGATLQFQGTETMSDGSAGSAPLTWSATGGTITQAGLFTAGSTAGSYTVTATAPNGVAGSASGTVTAGPPSSATLTGIVVTPNGASVQAGGTQQYQAVGQLSSGGTTQVSVTWSATGGTISGSGLYTAGGTAGSFRVTATGPGGVTGSANVTVTAAPPPPPPPPSGNYQAVIGEDWRSYQSKAQLQAQNLFWWYRSEDVYQHVDLVADPTFGQVVRIKFQQSAETGFAPKMRETLPQPLGHIWFRWRIKYVPGWTTVGPNPAGYANSWKMAFWNWADGYGGRGAIQLSNTDQNIMEWNVQNRSTGQFYNYSEQVLPGSTGQPLGSVSDAWQNGEWYEYVVHYQRLSDTQARQEYWYRRLTRGGQIANEPFLYSGAINTGSPIPFVGGIELGVNKNKSNPTTMYLMWGPWEVVDGSRYPNPFGIAR